jgi:hypothetical protein
VASLTPILAAAGYEDFREAGAPGRHCVGRRQTAPAANLNIVWNQDLAESVDPVVSGT